MLKFCLPSVLALLFAVTIDAAPPIYEADVRPILKTHCFQCHGERNTTEGNLDLRLRRLVVKGGDSGPAVTLGDANDSLLIQRVAQGEMPPGEDKRLSDREVEILRRWVNAKAPTDGMEPQSLEAEPYFTEDEKNWWAFRPVIKPRLPSFSRQAATPIDAFIQAKLAGRKPAPRADRATLIRRLYLDLLGIPPRPGEVRQFVHDSAPNAWNKLVDRVLASPRYGERWGRHWLDVAGYADSDGYTDEDRVRPHAWRYRDYVIRAMNQDIPYSQFIAEQLAGDELVGWPATTLGPEVRETLAATGFLRMAPDGTASRGVDLDLARNQVIADTVQIVGASLLGMTLQCAQCHDHRYDPIPQRDYYQFRAIFEPALNWRNWPSPDKRLVSLYSEDDKRRRAEIEARAAEVDTQRKKRVAYYIEKTLHHELLMVADHLQQPLRAAFHTQASKRTAQQKKSLEEHPNIANIREGSLYLYDRRRDARAKDLEKRRAEKLAAILERVQATGETSVTAETVAEFDPQAAAELEEYTQAAAEVRKFRIRQELQEFADQAKAIRTTIPQEHFLRVLWEEPHNIPDTFVFHRGDHQQPKEKVQPRGLTVLGGVSISPTHPGRTSERRLALARQLTNGEHPLTARVLANRIWAHHFGKGIVGTPSDFGRLGDRPTHPRLLDWMAAELMESGWSIKRLHRLILTSHVYQQSSVGDEALVAADPENRHLGRWPLRRLESETLRDAILHVTGKLNGKMYGQSVPVMEDEVGRIVLGKENLDGERKPTKPIPLLGEEFRRSVYIQVRRTRPFGVLESFDLPELAPNCTRRPSSNVAPQSLMLMNSDFILSMATAMAERLIREFPGRSAEQLQRGWELAFGQSPSASQIAGGLDFLQKQRQTFANNERKHDESHRFALASFCQALLGSNRFLYIE